MSAWTTAAICVLSAALGASSTIAFGLTRSHADTGQQVAALDRALVENTRRIDALAREVGAARAASNGTGAGCPTVAPQASASPPAPPAHETNDAPPAEDDALSEEQEQLVALAEEVIDRAARQRYWGERERAQFTPIMRRLPGTRTAALLTRVMTGLNGDFPPRTQGPPI
jgi:hypothetical protein